MTERGFRRSYIGPNSKYRFQNSGSYLIRDGGFLLGTRSRSRWSKCNEIDDENLDNERWHNPHINHNHVTVRQASRTRKTGYSDSVPRARGAPTPKTRSTFGSLCGRCRVGEAELSNALSQSRDDMLSYRPSTKRCSEYRYSCCQAMQCYSMRQQIRGSGSEL